MHAFGETAMRLPAALYRAGIPGLMLYLVLDLLNVWAAVFLYARYILKKTLSEIGLGKPFFHRYWCLAAVVLAAAQNGFYLVFAKGELYRWNLGFREQLSLLFSNLFIQGLRLAVMDGLLFRALVPAVFEKAGRKGMVIASGLMYAAVLLLSEPASFWSTGRFLLEFTALFLKGVSLILVAVEAGSVWPPCCGHLAEMRIFCISIQSRRFPQCLLIRWKVTAGCLPDCPERSACIRRFRHWLVPWP